MKVVLWRPVKSKTCTNIKDFWRVPMRMPKLHVFVAHVENFVRDVGCWVLQREEGFEHYYSVCMKLRSAHSSNLCTGGQILNNLQHSWLESLPEVAVLQAEAQRSGFRLKKRQRTDNRE